MSISPILMVMARAIEKASRSLVRDFGEVEKLQISMKGPGDFVSRADKRSEEILVESLQKDRPDWGILGEEGGAIASKDGRHRWIIDPLDGTSNFLHGLPHWCITVALERDGEVVAGMTFDPIRQEMFRAEKGGGAFMNNTRLRVAGRKKIENLLNCFYHYPENPNVTLAQGAVFEKAGSDVRTFGAGALDLAYTAAGRFDACCFATTKTNIWDWAAGALMLREAGGVITSLDGNPLKLDGGTGFLAANPALHKAFAAELGLAT